MSNIGTSTVIIDYMCSVYVNGAISRSAGDCLKSRDQYFGVVQYTSTDNYHPVKNNHMEFNLSLVICSEFVLRI